MSNRRVVVGQSEWRLPDGDVTEILDSIQTAMEKKETVRLGLLDTAGRQVTVILNPEATSSVVIDLNDGPRPTEYSG
jgi:hypothetical protein